MCTGGALAVGGLADGRVCTASAETLHPAAHPRRVGCVWTRRPQVATSRHDQLRGTPSRRLCRRRGGRRERVGGGGGGGGAPGRPAPLQDGAVPVVRRDGALPLRAQVPVRARRRRAAAARATSALPHRAVPLVPRDRLLSVRIAMQLHTRRRHGGPGVGSVDARDARRGATSAAATRGQLPGAGAAPEAVE